MNANSEREYIDNKVGDLRSSVDDLRTTVNERFDTMRMTMDAGFKTVDAKIEAMAAKVVSEVVRWVVGLFITLIVLTVGLASVVMNLFLRQPPPVAAAPVPAVIIQLSPQGATVLPAAPAGGKP
nr:hypothetical protein [uncultured Duganella sp.]